MPLNTVAITSHQVSDGTLLVNPGYLDESYLVEKILDAPRYGRRMPRDMPPLPDEEIEIIRRWVRSGVFRLILPAAMMRTPNMTMRLNHD